MRYVQHLHSALNFLLMLQFQVCTASFQRRNRIFKTFIVLKKTPHKLGVAVVGFQLYPVSLQHKIHEVMADGTDLGFDLVKVIS